MVMLVNIERMIVLRRARKLICALCTVLCVVIAGTISAYAVNQEPITPYSPLGRYYSNELTVTVPGLNGNVNTLGMIDPLGSVYKGSDDTICTFFTVSNPTGAGADARLINYDRAKRSAWARDLITNSIRTATTTATDGYLYYAQISSDLLQFSSFDITFKFSPDDMR